MNFLFDFFPILLFFLAYKLGNIYIATVLAIGASAVQVLWLRFKKGHFEKLPLITLGLLTLFGGATLFFQNEIFIKWKPTAVYWILALSFLLSQFFGSKPLIQTLGEKSIKVPPLIWQRLNLSWVIFFTVMGFLNLYVIHHFDTNTWVNFKLFGTLILTLLFIILQSIYLGRHFQTKIVPVKNTDIQSQK